MRLRTLLARRREPLIHETPAEIALRDRRYAIYAEGLADGMETALRAFLGHVVDGATPCPSPLPPAVEEWARAALRNVQAVKADGEVELPPEYVRDVRDLTSRELAGAARRAGR